MATRTASSVFTIKALLVLDSDGQKIIGQYYRPSINEWPTRSKQNLFERMLSSQMSFKCKTVKLYMYIRDWQDVLLIDQNILIYQTVADISVCVVFGQEQNEILIGGTPEKRAILENYDVVSILFDEIIDDGVILEIDPQALIPRLPRRQRSESASPDIPLAEQTLTQAFQTAKYWKDQLLKG